MVHGLGGTSNVWEPQVRALSERYAIARFDLRGSGRSPADGALSIDRWVGDIEAVMDQAGFASAHLVGHSLGTLIAQHFAERHPERVESLALLGINRAPEDARRQTVRDRAAKVRKEGMPGIADGVIKAALAEETKRTKPEVIACVREMLLRQDPEGYARSCEAVAEAVGADLKRISCPVLLVAGSDDTVSPPAVTEKVAAELSRARTVVLEKCGHWLTLERPFEVNAALSDFLAHPQ
jgi:pimeloyl-ACP methyl ester carboxylesterase